MKSIPELTFIIPAYNMEKYIDQCIQSLILQSQIHHHVIIIDDGSKDRTGEIAQNYAEKYPDLIEYHRKENAGLGAARNTGMEYVTTPYVTFLDSDDWQHRDLVKRYIELMRRLDSEPDMIFTLPKIWDHSTMGYTEWHDERLFNKIARCHKYSCTSVLANPELYDLEVTACRKIYNVAFLKAQSFTFPEGVLWEDVYPHFILLHAAKSCAFIDVGFYYRINQGGQITNSRGAGRLDVITNFSRLLAVAYSENWRNDEISHIIRTLISFSHWSIEMTSPTVRRIFVRKLHLLFQIIPRRNFNHFLKTCSLRKKRDKFFIWILRLPITYRAYYDYLTVNNAKKVINKWRRK